MKISVRVFGITEHADGTKSIQYTVLREKGYGHTGNVKLGGKFDIMVNVQPTIDITTSHEE